MGPAAFYAQKSRFARAVYRDGLCWCWWLRCHPRPGIVTQLYNWMLLVPVNAGARGLLIGIGLATALTGLRIYSARTKHTDRHYCAIGILKASPQR